MLECTKKNVFEDKELPLKHLEGYKTPTDVASTLRKQGNLVSHTIPENSQVVTSSPESTKLVTESNAKETYAETFKKNLINFLKNMHSGFFGLDALTKKYRKMG